MNHPTMTDDELATAVRESVTGVHMTILAEQIMNRSRTIRARRRMPLVAGALAGVAGAALAVTALLPSSHQPGHPATARLTAWTVASQANGNIRSPSASCATRPGCSARSVPMACRSTSASPALR